MRSGILFCKQWHFLHLIMFLEALWKSLNHLHILVHTIHDTGILQIKIYMKNLEQEDTKYVIMANQKSIVQAITST